MTEQSRLTPQEELLDTLDEDWGGYVQRLHALSEEEQRQFAEAQGYADTKDFLVHIGGWWRATLEAIQAFRTGNSYAPDWKDDAEFEQRGIQEYRDVSLEQVERELEDVRIRLRGVISELTTEELENRDIYGWLYRTVVRQYDEHPLDSQQ